MNGQKSHKPQVSVVMVPFPAQGHLNQLLHLSRLISSYGIPVHYAGSTTHNRQAKHRLQGGNNNNNNNNNNLGGNNDIHFHDFQLPAYDSPPPNPHSSTHFPLHLQPLWDASIHLRQPISELLLELSSNSRRIVVIYDSLMAYVVQDVRDILNAESYSFVPCGAFTVFLGLWDTMNHVLPFEIDANDVIPSCNLPSNEGCFTPEMENFIAENVHKFAGLENGSLYNTSRVIEGKYVKLLERLSGKNCYAIGPFNPVEISKPKSEIQRHKCLEWLDKQEKESVVYVCFGTMTSISDEQINELAIGLEKSGQKFIWVLRDADKGDVFTENETVRKLELPEGYEERVKNRGIVVREWAPQLEILSHSSTGGFMSHCGWNSCMESISMGVAMATWPMHSDQPRNAVFVTQVLRIGTVVREWSRRSELVRSSDVVSAVTRLIASEEGAEMRRRAVELGSAVRTSIAAGGSSRIEMDSFIAEITK
ncbi:zeatin O-glucosyltransferase-like [Silene latifolia]|uniref:zeatin O-glucosyltransferase-like n=1 Tax=Silene latifolia TaxID=37657 RepID=UPI003D76B30F